MRLETEIRSYTYPSTPLAGKRLVYISDLHYHRLGRRRVERNIEQIRGLEPDLLLLGGDYIDTPFGLPNFQRFVEAMDFVPFLAIGGNHDRPYLRSVRFMVEKAGGTWVHNGSTTVRLGGARVRVDGTNPREEQPPADLAILCLHHPIDVSPFAEQYNLAFAGHLHGSQIVLWQTPKGLYPGRWIYPLNQLDIQHGSCRYIISKGIGDTLPIRYQCSRDIILINFEHQS
ncbi:MAG: metallophosphoesterase [Bacteroidetes bacterium]|nr:metallophosphoesterase [Bacteroidota bacterium]